MVLDCEVVSFAMSEASTTGEDPSYSRLARKNSPEMFSASARTTTIFWPFNSCLATMLAKRPRRWPLPSMTICSGQHLDLYPKPEYCSCPSWPKTLTTDSKDDMITFDMLLLFVNGGECGELSSEVAVLLPLVSLLLG